MDAPATPPPPDIDPEETREWLEALVAAVRTHGKPRGEFLPHQAGLLGAQGELGR